MNVETVRTAAKLMRDGWEMLSRGPFDFYLTELVAAHDLLMTRFAPFKVGDRVRLTKRPDFEKCFGWKGCEHFLVVGAIGSVKTAGCGTRGFSFGIAFDDDSWIDRDGAAHPTQSEDTFVFGESWLALEFQPLTAQGADA